MILRKLEFCLLLPLEAEKQTHMLLISLNNVPHLQTQHLCQTLENVVKELPLMGIIIMNKIFGMLRHFTVEIFVCHPPTLIAAGNRGDPAWMEGYPGIVYFVLQVNAKLLFIEVLLIIHILIKSMELCLLKVHHKR